MDFERIINFGDTRKWMKFWNFKYYFCWTMFIPNASNNGLFNEGFDNCLLVIVFLPLFIFLLIHFYGSYLGDYGSAQISLIGTFWSLLHLSLFIFTKYGTVNGSQSPCYKAIDFFPDLELILFKWVDLNYFEISWSFHFDILSVFMLFVIVSITFAVQLYSVGYMLGDPYFAKFFSYLSLFSFFMSFLVSSSNLFQIFIGWEGVGLVSFLLVSFWSTRRAAVLSGIKAVLVNRVGDVFFLSSIAIAVKEFKTLNVFDIILIVSTSFQNWTNELVIADSFTNSLIYFVWGLVIASMAKSAQLGLHMWLPDAMEGPTPVSALIHAATMVTAGVFLLIRFSPIVALVDSVLAFLSVLGGLTALFGATVACVQFDIKKVIAYSTCSQLGYMVLSCGSGNFVGAFYHLFNHAFFKAMLFLSAGSVIHALGNEQDMRKMGSLVFFLPLTFVLILFGSFSLMGFPYFSGFYSKDFILESAYCFNSNFSITGFFLGLSSTFFTAFYSFRLLYLVFFAPYSGFRVRVFKIHEASFWMLTPMILLWPFSVFGGYLFSEFFTGSESYVWFFSLSFKYQSDFFIIPAWVKLSPLFFSFSGFALSFYIYVYQPNYLFKFFVCYPNNKSQFVSNIGFDRGLSFFLGHRMGCFASIYYFMAHKWYLDEFVNRFVRLFFYFLHFGFWRIVERGVFVFFGPRGVYSLVNKFKYKFLQYFGSKAIIGRVLNLPTKNFGEMLFLSVLSVFFVVIIFFILNWAGVTGRVFEIGFLILTIVHFIWFFFFWFFK